jgi:Spy/CpxP family protein refolding chaperone
MKQIMLAGLMTVLVATGALAQRGHGGGRNPQASLQSALNLTQAQLTAIQTLNQTRHDRAEVIMTEIEKLHDALDALLDAASPNPTNVGNAAIAVRAAQNRLAAERDWYIAELKKLLTGEQQTILDNLLASANNPILPGLGLDHHGRP